ncbi:TPA: hypothetical protein ACUM2C_001145 [Haemophilus influenzae]|uniref:hypothetical protein n=1 Tax=Haemophilus influenzae TaxID=727 RepID=UPI000F6C195C|nr:hypothetical protein [Haemophilus influenzae]MBZ5690922.1 hypothetical protein [Haemophilus influenzae]MCK8913607.1 hypothetical protein [Haemophilus influenzae]MCK8923214.1 hypothetical protein [Haemophilus influenzae]MCK9642867.1 hypothetical protein [Haemophilus influenzae]VEI56021.1 Uncharacterised protein [Haemophilus influenzae]
MARNELSKDAIKNADLIRQKAANTKDVHAADYIGVDRLNLPPLWSIAGKRWKIDKNQPHLFRNLFLRR